MLKKIEEYKTKIIVITIIIVLVITIKIIDNKLETKEKTENINILNYKSEEKEEESTIKIYITGQVNSPGVIELPEGSRISDAIEIAGGLTENANIKNVNLAYPLEDGEKIYIPNLEENVESINNMENIDDGISQNQASKININKASSKDLQSLNGIGESLASSIIEYREKNGKFKNVDELLNVPGIGEAKFSKIKEQIKVK